MNPSHCKSPREFECYLVITGVLCVGGVILNDDQVLFHVS